ncbi:MAG: hypothetical protein AAI978_00115 [Candidatus Hodgkinia cicadicola]
MNWFDLGFNYGKKQTCGACGGSFFDRNNMVFECAWCGYKAAIGYGSIFNSAVLLD